jgi:hypothetical protein
MLWSRIIASATLVPLGYCSLSNLQLALGAVVCLVALWMRWSWARWLGQGLALAGILVHGEEFLFYDPVRTPTVVGLVCSLALMLPLLRRRTAEAFEARVGWGEERRPHLAFVLLIGLAGFVGRNYAPVLPLVLGAVAVYRRWSWARFYVLAVAVTGLLGHLGLWVLAAVHPKVEVVSLGYVWSVAAVCLAVLEQVTLPILLALLLGAMAGPGVSDGYEARVGWHSCSWRERVLAAAIICSGGIVAMLVQQIGLRAAGQALPLLALLLATLAGAILSFRRLTIGLLLLGGAGIVTLVIGIEGMALLLREAQTNPDPVFGCGFARGHYFRALFTYAMTSAGLVCGATTAVTALLVFLGPMVRFLRR